MFFFLHFIFINDKLTSILGQQLVQLPGGKLHVLHTQQTGGVTSTSVAGNAILKKITVPNDGSQKPDEQQLLLQEQQVSTGVNIENSLPSVSTSEVKQISATAVSQGTAVKQLVPVTKIQMSPMSGVKSTQVW